MRHGLESFASIVRTSTLLFLLAVSQSLWAVEVLRLSETTWDGIVPEGKEVDCIYGDWVLRNDKIVAVIAEALPTRHANMTVRNVGGAVIDLTTRENQSDQLSAYVPLAGQYQLTGPTIVAGPQGVERRSSSLVLQFKGKSTDERSTAEVSYSLRQGESWLVVTTTITNVSSEPLELNLSDAIRADGEFEFGKSDVHGLLWAYDPFWRQAYGSMLENSDWKFAGETPKKGDRPSLPLARADGKPVLLPPGESIDFARYLFPAGNTIDLMAIVREIRGEKLEKVAFEVRSPDGPLENIEIQIKTRAGELVGSGRTDERGMLSTRLPRGFFLAWTGESAPLLLEPGKVDQAKIELPDYGYVNATVTGDDGESIPCKVQFIGRGDTKSPNFGPDSAIYGVRNVRYTADGTFHAPLAPGEYDVIISHGPEFDAVFTTLKIERGKEATLAAKLSRVVDTKGWLSADFHSHSTPSGDNTASQRGRVLNLLVEHLEFAPCTEHNRVTVYDAHLKHFGAEKRMLTCPGIEVTGRPLPINHQNAFPLVHKPRTQDGGGPTADADPVVQIERLAMWDGGAEKLVQINHPNIPQMVGDRDLNGSPDGGFEKMFSFMDVVEIHPLGNIFTKPEKLPTEREIGNSIFHWLQLNNLGYRVPGVVNTDAHWNFHGSGFLRNYIKSSTDDPTAASVSDLVHTCEHGNIMLTNGPFMEVTARAGEAKANVGDDLAAPAGKLQLAVRVQCPKWIEVNRVQVFVNGMPDAKLNFTRRTHSEKFRSGVVVFDEAIPVELASDAHLVVACCGEGVGLGPVVGPDHEKDMPAAVGNPIFVDVDGGGFKPNGDLLGLPLALEPGHKPSKPHGHKHPHKH